MPQYNTFTPDAIMSDTFNTGFARLQEEYNNADAPNGESTSASSLDNALSGGASATLENVISSSPSSVLRHYVKPTPKVRKHKKVGRNDACPCGSGLKYKNCCLKTGEYEGLE